MADISFGKLLYSDNADCYLSNISLNDCDKHLIQQARDAIRNCLREKYPIILEKITQKKPQKPRFFTQGSFKYKTLNKPEKSPPQQADIDDGCYLPMSYVVQTNDRPKTASHQVFMAAEEALEPLCKSKNWTLLTSKDTCIRIIITDHIHVDIPLYAIPELEFIKLEAAYDSGKFRDSASWNKLPVNSVLLAHRKNGWVHSDPREVSEWFLSRLNVHGEQFRRIVRYIKAIRDHLWDSGGPSSLLLMVLVDMLYVSDYEDDQVLRAILSQISKKFGEDIRNPCDPAESLTDRLGSARCREASARFLMASQELESACHNASSDSIVSFINRIRNSVFGRRLPCNPSAVVLKEYPSLTANSFPSIRTKAG